VEVSGEAPWIPAVQYFGTKGFFPTYDARPGAPLTNAVARLWAEGFTQLRAGRLDPNALARSLMPLEDTPGAGPISTPSFTALLPPEAAAIAKKLGLAPDAPLTRADACRILFEL
jgi:hypothetical protein